MSISTSLRVLLYRGIDESRDRFKHFMQSEPRGIVGSFFDFTRITRVVSASHYQNLGNGLKSTFCFKIQCKRFN